ncbi:unnamed protein product [Paramecium sonneborni]|uniref:Uncharacterized protein n=1 Tax=Paramecium sonneborni TaxID=65129 RepID=A0A8S1QX06_9CILI|nr:unnamed protein product [Paramecium sonneborni]
MHLLLLVQLIYIQKIHSQDLEMNHGCQKYLIECNELINQIILLMNQLEQLLMTISSLMKQIQILDYLDELIDLKLIMLNIQVCL